MIVCHCNQISAERLCEATSCLLKKDQCADLCPAKIYEELGCCPKCCNCFPLAEKVIQGAAQKQVQETPIIFHRSPSR
jgi:bacterioferritin-associated ferredoxin